MTIMMNNSLFVYEIILKIMFVMAPIIFLSLLFFSAPYGRHARHGFGPSIPNRWGWILMELPAVLVILFCFSDGIKPLASYVLLALWEIHYIDRTFIFPFRLRNASKPMPIMIPAMGFIFNAANGYINGISLTITHTYTLSWLIDPRFIIGLLLFIAGFAINRYADWILLHLRKPGENSYNIPQGGLYRWISCPNYLGEIIQWMGWAISTWSLAGLAFFLWTFANLAPRALLHHRWYRETFPDYPKTRRALIPWVL
jgi:3-oxo-5-alpha-steroid 4-dehydrogenase 1